MAGAKGGVVDIDGPVMNITFGTGTSLFIEKRT